MTGGGLKGVAAAMAWTDELASWPRMAGKSMASVGTAAHRAAESLSSVYVDSLTAVQRELLEEVVRASGAARRGGEAADRLTAIFSQASASMEEELSVGGGWAWPSVEGREWARARIPGVRADEERVGGFWAGEKAVPGGVGDFGRGGRRASPVASPRMRRWRIGETVYAWVPDGLDGSRAVSEASRRPRQAVPAEVLDAEKRLRAAAAAAEGFAETMARLGHVGPVTGPGLRLDGEGPDLTVGVDDWRCEACGAETADEELFAELRCGTA